MTNKTIQMNLTHRQITLLAASLLSFQKQYSPVGEFYQELDELIEILDQKHQKIMDEMEVSVEKEND